MLRLRCQHQPALQPTLQPTLQPGRQLFLRVSGAVSPRSPRLELLRHPLRLPVPPGDAGEADWTGGNWAGGNWTGGNWAGGIGRHTHDASGGGTDARRSESPAGGKWGNGSREG
jgi:hypothetical protein